MEPLALLNNVKLEGWQILAFAIIQMAAMYLWTKLKSFATTAIQNLASKAWEDLRYLWKYKTYVKDFKIKQKELSALVKSIKFDIKEANNRNKTLIDPRVEYWLERANEILQKDTEPTKFIGLCTNCFSQIVRAKELESLTKEMPTLIAKVKELPKEVAWATGAPDMELHSQEEFMSFEGRKENFEELKKELQDENHYMIGLQGIGGTGKSTMAIEVWKHVEKSKAFDRVIFIKVSTPVDEKRIRDDIAKKLELQLEEEKLWTHAQQIWRKIADTGKVLIILDDVWEKLDLKNMGIQPGFHNKGRCYVLLTTRIQNVCTQMGCQEEIKLEDLDEKDALNLFLFHAIKTGHDCPDDLKNVALDIVNECGRLPVIIVPMAKTIKDFPAKDWQHALIALKSANEPPSLGIVDEDAIKFYNSLKLSYTHLKDKQAQVLLLLSSIFPKAHEIPVDLLSRIAIGLGLFGEVGKYNTTRSQVHVKKNKLINYSLLSKAGEECVKMHDVIREEALKIGNKEIQVIMDCKTNLKENMIYSSWIINGFPNNCSDDSKLEVLLVWINADGSLKVPNTIFRGMKSLRVLLLYSKIEFGRTVALSLPESIQSLKDIRTLSLTNLELGDILVLMRNLQNLESLELNNCSIVELPKEISEQDTLRFLCLIRCLIKNNPFEVIARCGQLEELYYVSNDDNMPLISAKVPQITPLPAYQIYHIDGSNFSPFDSSQLDASIKKVFKPAKLQRIFSKEIIKSLAARAEILELEGDDETASWNNLIPGIVSIEDGGAMKDLIKLSLKDWSEMKCLIDTEQLQLKSSRVTIFSKLAELQLVNVNVREICCGPYPDGFLKNLEKMDLKKCQKLEGTLFKGKLKLGNLKSIGIVDCSMTSLFHASTAQSLRRLETLKITRCSKLKYITRVEGSSIEEKVDGKDHNPMKQVSLFPKLKLLSVKECEELEFILPICFCEDLPLLESVHIYKCENLKYMFGQYPEEGGLHQMQKENSLASLKAMSIEEVPSFVNIYPECYLPEKSVANTSEGSNEKGKSSPSPNVTWGSLCCFMSKSKSTNKNELSTSNTTQPGHTISQEKYIGKRAQGIFTPPLYPCNLREMKIKYISKLSSLFSISIASSMLHLEELVVQDCDGLEHIVKEEVDGDDGMNANSIFLNLRAIRIEKCNNLEYVFPASFSRNLGHLEYVHISRAKQLKYMFGEYCSDDNHNTKIHVTSLSKLHLEEVPNMVSMCPENYYLKASSLQDITLNRCPQLPINSLIDLSVQGHQGQEQLSREKLMGMHLCNLKHLTLESLEDMEETIYDLQRFEIASPVKNSSLKSLTLRNLPKLRNLCVGPKNLLLSFQHLFKLKIYKCHQLKFILCASISRSLPHLRYLRVWNCEELERIIEDDGEECSFPNLHRIFVTDCKRLECLFSISTSAKLPQLSWLSMSGAPEMEKVFEWKQISTQDLEIKHVFPNLLFIDLIRLPKLHTVCSGIDFQTVICRLVMDCPNISLTSTDTKLLDRYMDWFKDSERNKGNMDEDDIIERLVDRTREVAEKTIKRDWPTDKANNASSNIKEIAEARVEESPKSDKALKADEVNDSEQIPKAAPFAAPSQIESPQRERGLHLHSKDPQSKPYDFPSNAVSSQVRVTVTAVREGEADADIDNMMIPPMDPKDAIKFSCLAQLHVLHNTIEKIDLKMRVGIVGLDPYSFGIDKKDLNEFLSMQEIDIAWVQLAILYFHNICTSTGRNGLYGFLCPAAVQKAHNTLDWRMRYVGYVIGKDKLPCYLTPIIEGFHWMLCVACPMDNVVYWFDSLGHSPSSEIQTVFNTALKTYLIGGESSCKNSPTTWIQLNCPRQQGNKECGYYVIRYMYEIIHSGSTSKFEEIFNNKDPYPIEDINFIRDLLAKQLLQELFSQKADRVKDSEQTNKPAPFAAPSEIDSPQETMKPNSQEGSQGKEVVMTHLSEIHMSKNSKVEAQARKAELKDQISKLQAELDELDGKEKETEEGDIKPLSLQELKKKGVSDIGHHGIHEGVTSSEEREVTHGEKTK